MSNGHVNISIFTFDHHGEANGDGPSVSSSHLDISAVEVIRIFTDNIK